MKYYIICSVTIAKEKKTKIYIIIKIMRVKIKKE